LISFPYQSETCVIEIEREIVVVLVVSKSVLVVDPVVGPVVVQVGGESNVRVRVLWVGSSDVWLRIFLGHGFSLDHFVVEVEREIVIVLIVSKSVFVVNPIVSPVIV